MRLTRWEKKWLAAITEGFAPSDQSGRTSDGGMAPKPGEVDYAAGFERLNHHGTALAQVGLRFGIALVGLSPIWSGKGMRGLDGLSPTERVEQLEALTTHRSALVRELTWLMKIQSSMVLFGTASVRERSGYDRDRSKGMPTRLTTLRRSKLRGVA